MKKILVPCDFSKPAINAFRFALDVARQSKGSIHLLHVIELPVLHDSIIMPVLNFEEELLKELKEKTEGEFKKLKAKYNMDGVKVTAKVVFGAVSTMILDYIPQNRMDLVIMGSHGVSGAREFFIGSNAEKIVRKSPVPVLTTKQFYKGPIKNIVFPNNLETENQRDLIEKVKVLQSFFKAQLNVVWINTLERFTGDVITLNRLKTFAKEFKLTNYKTHIFNSMNEEDGILEFSRLIDADMIAMATHGYRGIAHILNGSMAEAVVNHGDKLMWTYTLRSESEEIGKKK
jgi:nucleotide-binding universal stress UspA family protein